MIRAHISEMTVEEVANATTHGFGLVLSVIGSTVLLVVSLVYGDKWHIIGNVIYGLSLVTLYAASTVYHTVIEPSRKRFFQLLDHTCIFVLIAGTYTPFLLTVFSDFSAWLMVFIWATATLGILMKVVFRERVNAIGIVLYLLLGWVGIFLIKPMYNTLGLVPLMLVVGGGVSYTLGMIFFGWHRIRHHHAIFHVFVLVGSILHYVVIAGFLTGR